MFSGVTAGSIAAIIAVLVSLPLRSPSDTLLNSASVTLAGLLSGALAGLIWVVLRRTRSRTVYFLVIWSAFFLPAAAAMVLYGRSQLDHFAAFAVPLALIIYLGTGALTVSIARYLPRIRWWGAGAAIAVAIVVGIGLVNQADQESGRLELPPPGSHAVPSGSPVFIETNTI